MLLLLLLLGGCSSDDGGNAPPTPPAPPSPPPVATVTIAPDSVELGVGETRQLSAALRDAQGRALSGRTITWTSSTPTIASVSSTGVVTAVAPGRGVITVTSEGRSGDAVIRVVSRADTLPGNASDPAVAVVSFRLVETEADEYRSDHPLLGGLPVSVRTATVILEPQATIGGVNALLEELQAEIIGAIPGAPGSAPGVLFLRLRTSSTHEAMDAALAKLRGSSHVRAATRDSHLSPLLLPIPSADRDLTGWRWTLPQPGGGSPEANWGLKAIRAPQLWNLNSFVEREGSPTLTGVLDSGFGDHPDLIAHRDITRAGVQASLDHGSRVHGTLVGGVVGAVFDNGFGVDGVNPFARLVIKGGATSVAGLGTRVVELLSPIGFPGLRVLNLSLGYNWYKRGDESVNPMEVPEARAHADAEGAMFAIALSFLQRSGQPLPVIIAASGNDAADYPNLTARYTSPFNNAAIAQGVQAIIVVEAVQRVSNSLGVERAPFSVSGGLLSAPGVEILTTSLEDDVSFTPTYGRANGTSLSAPHVSGLVSYLYSLDPAFPAPTLEANPMLQVLVESAIRLTDAGDQIDAFAAALELDRVRGANRILRGLLDIDDGTPDGNTRVDPVSGALVLGNVAGARDGRVDMRDFRRFRDWLLQAENAPGLALDGPADHLKRDLNQDGEVETPVLENVYPRGDFNGDGIIHRTARIPVGGVFGGASHTDLQVFQRLFDDELYTATELPGLLNSGDLDIHPLKCLAIPGAVQVRASLYRSDEETAFRVVSLGPDNPRRVLTESFDLNGYRALLEAKDAGGETVGMFEQHFVLEPGSDRYLDPDCLALNIQLVFPEVVEPGTPQPLNVTAMRVTPRTGEEAPAEGAQVSISVIGGVVQSPFGTLNVEGAYNTSVTSSPGAETLTIIVEVDIAEGSNSALVQRQILGPVPCGAGTVSTLSVAGDQGLQGLAGVGHVTGRLTLRGTFEQLVDLRSLCEVGDDFTVGPGVGVLTSIQKGIRLDGLRFVGRSPNVNNPSSGVLRFQSIRDVETLEVPNLEYAEARIGGSVSVSGGVAVRNNFDLRRFALGRDGGDLRAMAIVVETNPVLEELFIRSAIRGHSFTVFAEFPGVPRVQVQRNDALRKIQTGRFWAHQFWVFDNPELTEIQLGAGSEIDFLHIRGNASLRNLDGIPCGTRILNNLIIEENPQLDIAAVEARVGCWAVQPNTNVVIR